MKFSLAILILFSCIGSSYAYSVGMTTDAVTSAQSARKMPYTNNATPAYNYWTMPSTAELTAKLDSQEIQMNLLFDAMDSMNRVQVKQTASIKRLKRSNTQNKAAIKDENKQREEHSQQSTWIISLLGLTTAIGAFFALKLFLAKRKSKV